MTTFTSFDKRFANLILQGHRQQVEQWSKDNSNPDLADACKMLIEAGKQEHEK